MDPSHIDGLTATSRLRPMDRLRPIGVIWKQGHTVGHLMTAGPTGVV